MAVVLRGVSLVCTGSGAHGEGERPHPCHCACSSIRYRCTHWVYGSRWWHMQYSHFSWWSPTFCSSVIQAWSLWYPLQCAVKVCSLKHLLICLYTCHGVCCWHQALWQLHLPGHLQQSKVHYCSLLIWLAWIFSFTHCQLQCFQLLTVVTRVVWASKFVSIW